MKCTLTFFTCGPLGDLEFTFEDDRDLSLRGVTSELIGPDLGELTAAKKLKRWLNSFDPRHTVTFSFSVNCEDAHTMRDGEHFFLGIFLHCLRWLSRQNNRPCQQRRARQKYVREAPRCGRVYFRHLCNSLYYLVCSDFSSKSGRKVKRDPKV